MQAAQDRGGQDRSRVAFSIAAIANSEDWDIGSSAGAELNKRLNKAILYSQDIHSPDIPVRASR